MDSRYNQYGAYNAPQYGAQYAPQQEQSFIPRTAINDLDSLLSEMTEDERGHLFSHPEFGAEYSDFLSKFMFYLLQSDVGARYINSSKHRSDMAEDLILRARRVASEGKKSKASELDRLQRENEEMKRQLDKLKVKEQK